MLHNLCIIIYVSIHNLCIVFRDGSTRQPTIRIHNADPRSNSVRPSLFVSSDGSLHPGGRHEQVFQGGLHGLLSNLICKIIQI